MTIIYHLTGREAWAEAQKADEYEAPSLAEEGFIHCSGTRRRLSGSPSGSMRA